MTLIEMFLWYLAQSGTYHRFANSRPCHCYDIGFSSEKSLHDTTSDTLLFATVAHRDIETKRHLTYFQFLITHPPSNVKKVSEKNLVDRHPFLGMAAQIQPRQHRLGRKGWTQFEKKAHAEAAQFKSALNSASAEASCQKCADFRLITLRHAKLDLHSTLTEFSL